MFFLLNLDFLSQLCFEIVVGNLLHLIVEACIARNLVDTSAYFWPGYVVPLEESSRAQESSWSSLTDGSPLMELKDALMVTPASR